MGAEARDVNAVLAEQQTKRNPTLKPAEGYLILKIAKEYGQAPEDVEKWDAFLFNRAAVLMEGEGLHQAAESKAMERRSKARR